MKRLTLIEKAFLLKESPLFSSLDLNLLLTIADKLILVRFDANDFVFLEEEEANRMYFIVDGYVKIKIKEEDICQLGPGNFFGDESLFSNKPRGYAAYTPLKTHVLTLSRTNLYAIISECPSVAVGFLKVYTSEMQFRPYYLPENRS